MSRPRPAPNSLLLPLILTFFLLLLLFTPQRASAQGNSGDDGRSPESEPRPDTDRSVEEQLAGEISVAQAANRIAKAIRAAYPGMSSLLIYNDGDIRLLLVYGAVTKRIDAYTTRYAHLAAAESAALAADPAWAGPSAPCDEAAFAQERVEIRNAPVNSTGVASNSDAHFGDSLALFRADAGVRPSAPDAGEPVLVTEVFRALREQYHGSVALYYPTEMPPGFDPARDSRLLDKLEALFNAKANAEAAAAQIVQRVADKRELISRLQKCRAAADASLAALQKLVGDRQKKSDDLDRAILLRPKGRPTAAQRALRLAEREGLADLRARLEPRAAALWSVRQRLGDDVRRLEKHLAALGDVPGPLAALNAQSELLTKDLTRADDKTGSNPLAAFIRAEMIQKFMQENDAYWLKLRVVAAGGSTRVRSNLFADLFKGGGRVWYSGASIVEYHLYDRLGRSLLSDTTNSYEEYRTAEDVKKLADDRDAVDQR
ncbi:MAG TPA: hypothetical protein VGP08_16420 [Pyrinomonadaceae bacterium]|jgi:hypothetical protein|nr:hypothetical protein [Pyrinomonadaceae bacterium]